MKMDVAIALCNLSFTHSLRTQLLAEGALESVLLLVRDPPPPARDTVVSRSIAGVAGTDRSEETNWRSACTIRNLAAVRSNRPVVVSAGTVAKLVVMASRDGATDATMQACAAAICSLSKPPECRARIVDDGAVPVLIKLSELPDANTKQSCSSAMSNLSSSATEVDHGTVTALIAMSLTDDDSQDTEKKGAADALAASMAGGANAKKKLKETVQKVVNVNWMSHLDDINSSIPPPVMMRDIAPPPLKWYLKCSIKSVHVVKESAGGATEALPPPPPQESNTQTVPIPAVATSKSDVEDGMGELVDRYEKMHLAAEGGTGGETTVANTKFTNDVPETSWA
jgi:hypothetical protein